MYSSVITDELQYHTSYECIHHLHNPVKSYNHLIIILILPLLKMVPSLAGFVQLQCNPLTQGHLGYAVALSQWDRDCNLRKSCKPVYKLHFSIQDSYTMLHITIRNNCARHTDPLANVEQTPNSSHEHICLCKHKIHSTIVCKTLICERAQ